MFATRSKMLPRILALLAWGLMLVAPARAQEFDLPGLMRLLAASSDSEVSFVEKKYSNLLQEPVTSSGTLSFKRPDTVEKHLKKPREERYRIAGDELIVVRKGGERRLPLASQPLLAAFAASLRGVLTGDATLLKKYYRLSLQGKERAWTLELEPLGDDIGRYVERVIVNGRGAQIEQMEVRERTGDWSVMQIQAGK